jgi:prepilin peptidase CpaA
MLAGFVFTLLVAALLYAAVSDLLTMTIPNRLTLFIALTFIAIAPFSDLPMDILLWHLAAGALVLAVCFGFFAMGWLGGGDAKLAAGVALWLGMSLLIPWLLMTAIFGGALTVVILLVRQLPLPRVLHDQPWALRLHDSATGIPYGIAISAGALWVLPMSLWAQTLN